MRWPFRKKPVPDPAGGRLRTAVGVFRCVVQVGDPSSRRIVSGEVLDRLLLATKQPALDALDRRFGTESWCSRISTNASLEGPGAYFALDVTVPPGETMVSMSDLVNDEFARRWHAAGQRFLS